MFSLLSNSATATCLNTERGNPKMRLLPLAAADPCQSAFERRRLEGKGRGEVKGEILETQQIASATKAMAARHTRLSGGLAHFSMSPVLW